MVAISNHGYGSAGLRPGTLQRGCYVQVRTHFDEHLAQVISTGNRQAVFSNEKCQLGSPPVTDWDMALVADTVE